MVPLVGDVDSEYPPTIGSTVTADGSGWLLTAQYREPAQSSWQPSEMRFEAVPERVDTLVIGSEDPLPELYKRCACGNPAGGSGYDYWGASP